jgi:hypothetical protein
MYAFLLALPCLLGTLLPAPALAYPNVPDSTSRDSTRFRNHRYNEHYRANRDLSYIAPGGELGAPSRYVINGEAIASYFLLDHPTSRVSAAVMQRFQVRTRTEFSAPVRTPSFRLGAQVFYRLGQRTDRYTYLEGQFFHHSNGQDGPVFRPNGTYNTETGDFSTNYLQLTYNWGTHLPARRWGTYYHLGYRWHAPFLGHSEGLPGRYGFGRVLGQALFRWFGKTNNATRATERFRATLHASYAVNPLTNWPLSAAQRRLNAELTLFYVPAFSRDAGLFTTLGYYGEDPYNIYFNDRYGFVRFGIAVGFTRYGLPDR